MGALSSSEAEYRYTWFCVDTYPVMVCQPSRKFSKSKEKHSRWFETSLTPIRTPLFKSKTTMQFGMITISCTGHDRNSTEDVTDAIMSRNVAMCV